MPTVIFIMLAFILVSVLFPFFIPLLLIPLIRNEAAPSVYVHPSFRKEEVTMILARVIEAEQRVASILGKKESAPIWLFLSPSESGSSWNLQGNQPATTLNLPFYSVIVVKPSGQSADVIAHELMHSDLYSRIGWYNSQKNLPAWFDEGFALLADYRFHDAEVNWQRITMLGTLKPSIEELSTRKGFDGYTENSPLLSYYTSYKEVNKWLKAYKSPEDALQKLIEGLNKGQSFAEAYSSNKP